jgi:hypothetical protein
VFYKAIPTPDVTNPVSLPPFYVCTIFPSYLTLLTLHFSHQRANWSSPSFSSTTLRNVPGHSDLLREESMFQHHTKLYSKCTTFTSFFLKLSPICWWKESSPCWKLLVAWQFPAYILYTDRCTLTARLCHTPTFFLPEKSWRTNINNSNNNNNNNLQRVLRKRIFLVEAQWRHKCDLSVYTLPGILMCSGQAPMNTAWHCSPLVTSCCWK